MLVYGISRLGRACTSFAGSLAITERTSQVCISSDCLALRPLEPAHDQLGRARAPLLRASRHSLMVVACAGVAGLPSFHALDREHASHGRLPFTTLRASSVHHGQHAHV